MLLYLQIGELGIVFLYLLSYFQIQRRGERGQTFAINLIKN